MKKIKLSFGLLATVVLILFSSACSNIDDDYGYDKYSWATVNFTALDSYFDGTTSSDYYILTDSGYKLVPSNQSEIDKAFNFVDGQRIVVYYNLLDMNDLASSKYPTDLKVEIKQIDVVLTKDVLRTNQLDTLARNGIDPMNAFFGTNAQRGTRYLNIVFRVLGSNNATHYIYLADDTTGNPVDKDGYYNLYLRHNSNNDHQSYYLQGMASFKINVEALAEGIIGIRLHSVATGDDTVGIDTVYEVKY